ncbi:MAG TPA: hypothetical protein VEK13_05805 [Thermoplasmata archaeon]|nr:hypothetical protein [Thermoplasmata archaeon]
MSCVEALLRRVARDAEPEIQQRLHGLFGGMIRAYLPQTWVFRTEDGTASFRVDSTGRIEVASGADPSPDVTIEIGHDRLKAALTSRRREAVPPGSVTVTPRTAKGKVAFGYLRERIGL